MSHQYDQLTRICKNEPSLSSRYARNTTHSKECHLEVYQRKERRRDFESLQKTQALLHTSPALLKATWTFP